MSAESPQLSFWSYSSNRCGMPNDSGYHATDSLVAYCLTADSQGRVYRKHGSPVFRGLFGDSRRNLSDLAEQENS
jgi:hypothetical protein